MPPTNHLSTTASPAVSSPDLPPAGGLCAIHQPNFFPRLTTLAKLFAADYWVVLDDVQFCRRDYQHRARLVGLGDSQRRQWLTIPTHLPHGRQTAIQDALIVEPVLSRRRTAQMLQQHYGASPHWPAFHQALASVIDLFDATDRTADVAEASTRILLNVLGWTGRVLRSSRLNARPGRSQRLADLAALTGARSYLCGTGGMRYLAGCRRRPAGAPARPMKGDAGTFPLLEGGKYRRTCSAAYDSAVLHRVRIYVLSRAFEHLGRISCRNRRGPCRGLGREACGSCRLQRGERQLIEGSSLPSLREYPIAGREMRVKRAPVAPVAPRRPAQPYASTCGGTVSRPVTVATVQGRLVEIRQSPARLRRPTPHGKVQYRSRTSPVCSATAGRQKCGSSRARQPFQPPGTTQWCPASWSGRCNG
ncbi:WbqC family protein [Streptomyces sp. N2A]|uniref:WbqC family protein n=1 Tax=Streptomyces sp. N2A TaxID=3073936 RepID=UPI0037DA10CA